MPTVADKRRAFRALHEHGRFDAFVGGVPNAELNAFFGDDVKKRS